MIRIHFILIAIFLLSGCEPKKADPAQYRMEDLVLIEFAGRLEEDYHKLHPIKAGEKSVLRMKMTPPDPSAEETSHEEPHLMDEP